MGRLSLDLQPQEECCHYRIINVKFLCFETSIGRSVHRHKCHNNKKDVRKSNNAVF